jgi:hypothetical protein
VHQTREYLRIGLQRNEVFLVLHFKSLQLGRGISILMKFVDSLAVGMIVT